MKSRIKVFKYSYAALFLLIFSCGLSQKPESNIPGYDLAKPAATLKLPEILEEISGLTDIDNHSVGCVQDEDGILFIYDLSKNEISEQFSFKIDGDYEGITKVGTTMYVLRSDGMIIEIPSFRSESADLITYETGIPAANNEGLCYDQDNNRLLIASKSKPGKGKENEDLRVVYGFDLETKKLSEDPVYEINLKSVRRFARKKNFEKNTGRNLDDIKLKSSAIAIHPISKKLYILSAADHLLLIFSNSGDLEHITALDDEKFNKAEGITFFENGDMIITNEGQDDSPTLLQFGYKGS